MNPIQLYLLVLLFVLPSAIFAQSVPKQYQGKWGAGPACKSPLSLRITDDTVTLFNGEDAVSYGDLQMSYSYFYGNGRRQGIMVALLADFNGSNSPFTVVFNSKEKRGVTTIDDLNSDLKKRFPIEGVNFRKCPSR